MEMNLDDLQNFLANIPEDKKLIAKGLLDELIFMQNVLGRIKADVKKRGVNPNALKIYNSTVRQYANIYKQLDLILRYSKNSDNGDALKDWLEAAK